MTKKLLDRVIYQLQGRIYSVIDHILFKQLCRWAKRRHPKKNNAWRKRKYWCKLGNRDWVFGTPKRYLPFLAWQHIVRHPRLKASMNPFLNPEYFENRKSSLQEKYAHTFRQAHC